MANSFASKGALKIDKQDCTIFRLAAVVKQYPQAERLPFSMKVLLENLLRREDGQTVRAEDVAALAQWDAKAEPSRETAFMPARVLLQDFTGVPAVVDLAAMRAAMKKMGGDPRKINPLQPVELVIDHSVQVDRLAPAAGRPIGSAEHSVLFEIEGDQFEIEGRRSGPPGRRQPRDFEQRGDGAGE